MRGAADLAGAAELSQALDLALALDPGRVVLRQPAISRAMRLRICSAKCGVEAPMSWRTSSTVTSWSALPADGTLGFAHGGGLDREPGLDFAARMISRS